MVFKCIVAFGELVLQPGLSETVAAASAIKDTFEWPKLFFHLEDENSDTLHCWDRKLSRRKDVLGAALLDRRDRNTSVGYLRCRFCGRTLFFPPNFSQLQLAVNKSLFVSVLSFIK